MMRHGEAGCDTVVTAASGAATERVRVVPVTVVAGPDAPLCGCERPHIQWSATYTGGRTRRAYWLCGECLVAGFLLFPAETSNVALHLPEGVSRADAERGLAELAALVDEPVDALRLYVRYADDLMSRRGGWTEAQIVNVARESTDHLLAELRQKFAEGEQRRDERAQQLERQHERRMADIQRMIDRRKGRARVRLAKRPAPLVGSPYPTIAEGGSQFGRIIYGLVDPRRPVEIRYVGQTIRGPHQRLAQHIADAQYKGPKANWLKSLISLGLHPDMVLLEKVRPEADINALERWWIIAMRKEGQADLNATNPRPDPEIPVNA